MKAWFRQLADRLHSSYWFLPTVLTLGAILLSFITYQLDLHVGDDFLKAMGWVHGSKPDGARALLSAISSSMISVAGTVFAITIAAVVYASGNYGPRLLTNFMTDRGNQFSLGVFIATYVYCLLILRTIRQPDEAGALASVAGQSGGGGFVPELSLLTGLALALMSVGVLVYFLHHVPDSIRINHVVAAIGRRLLAEVEKRFPDDYVERPDQLDPPEGGAPVRAKRTGYIEVIDYSTLGAECKRHGVQVILAVRPGDFVHPRMSLLHVLGEMKDGCEDDLRDAFAMGDRRTVGQDIEFLIDELVEISLRALSPGINDPFTAITCLYWLEAATAELARRDLDRDADGRRRGDQGVFGLKDDFAHFMRRGFGAIRPSAAASPLTSRLFVDALATVAEGLESEERLSLVHAEARLLLAQADGAMHGPALHELRERVNRFTG